MTSLEYQEAIKLLSERYTIFPLHTARTLPDGVFLCTCGECGCTGKHPRVLFSNKSASEKEQIEYWYNNNREPAYGIGIHLGKSYNWVLDVDGNEGRQELSEITDKYGELPPTRKILTGGDGDHYYFSGWVDKIHSGALSENVHIKGNYGNAYVVAPPTLHVSGRRYLYENRCIPTDAPEWLTTLINTKCFSSSGGLTLTPEQIQSRKENEIPITSILSKEQLSSLHKEGNTLRGSHPIHGSKTKRNFCIDLETNRWFCNREDHHSKGGLFELAAMLSGICGCDDFKSRKDDEIYIKPLTGKKFVRSVQFCIDSGIDTEDLKVHMSGGKYVRC